MRKKYIIPVLNHVQEKNVIKKDINELKDAFEYRSKELIMYTFN